MKKIFGFLPALIASIILVSCGGGSSVSTSINVTMTDFQFTPNTFTVPAGQEISFSATNNGDVEHSFVIMKLGSSVNSTFAETDRANVYWEEPAVPAGQTVTAAFTAPGEPGEYQIICEVSGHFEAGMVATLVVVEGK